MTKPEIVRSIVENQSFAKASEIARASTVSMDTANKLRGYGLYKVATTGKGPVAAEKPNMFQVIERQKWYAHEAAFRETGGDAASAQTLYVAFVLEVNGLEPGSL